MNDDAELCRLAQEGDLIAASLLVTRHYARVYAYLRRLSNSDTEAEDLTQKTFFRVQTEDPDPSQSTAARDLAQRTYAEIDRLDEQLKQTVHLHYYQGLTLAETADVLGVSAGTVKNRLRETLDQLRHRLIEPVTQEP
jgi:DNA-directed RNA polymerase specialized sigma24 family protein